MQTNNPAMIEAKRTIANDELLGEVCTLLAAGKKVKIRAKGTSMEPFIHGDKDTLLLAPVETLHKGDIVLARISEGRYILHRIIRISGEQIILMGDGNLFKTEECSISDIYGIAVTAIRHGEERSLISFKSRLCAKAWRMLLTIRQVLNFRNRKLNVMGL